MHENKAQKPKTPREYLPTVESFSRKPKQDNGGSNKQVYRRPKKEKLGKKLWREWYKGTDWIRGL